MVSTRTSPVVLIAALTGPTSWTPRSASAYRQSDVVDAPDVRGP
jgi:hypothetical protein